MSDKTPKQGINIRPRWSILGANLLLFLLLLNRVAKAKARDSRDSEKVAEKHNFAVSSAGAVWNVVIGAGKAMEACFVCWMSTVTESCLQRRSMVRSLP